MGLESPRSPEPGTPPWATTGWRPSPAQASGLRLLAEKLDREEVFPEHPVELAVAFSLG